MAGILLLASLVSSCGALAGPGEVEVITNLLTNVEATQSNVTSAVRAASGSGQVMSVEVRALVDAASASLAAYNADVDDLSGDPAISREAESYAQSVNLVLDLLGEGNVVVAAEVAETQVTPKFETVSTFLRARQTELGGPPSSGRAVPIAVIAVVVAVAAALVLTRMKGAHDEPDQGPRKLGSNLAQAPR